MKWLRSNGPVALEAWFDKAMVLSDVDGRCVQAAQANAGQLGAPDHVEIRQRSLFAPVAGQQFNSIVFNLPLLYLDHGTPHVALDGCCRQGHARIFQSGRGFPEAGRTRLCHVLEHLERRGARTLQGKRHHGIGRCRVGSKERFLADGLSLLCPAMRDEQDRWLISRHACFPRAECYITSTQKYPDKARSVAQIPARWPVRVTAVGYRS